jgi:alkylation response protein AidB-like acyl-CoA dehydrogenase
LTTARHAGQHATPAAAFDVSVGAHPRSGGADRLLDHDAIGAVAAADRLAAALAPTAIERDRRGGTAKPERDLIRESGLLTLSIPAEHGGWNATWTITLAAVRRLARVDGSLAHLFGFHHLLLATVRLFGAETQWRSAYAGTVAHAWFWGNALNPLDLRTTIVPDGRDYLVEGEKSFCSGAADSDRLVISAIDHSQRLVVAVVPTDRAGIAIQDDWDNMGQRQTDSGTVTFRRVRVAESEILRTPGPLGSVWASLRPCIAQAILANVFLGIGEGALEEARAFTRGSSRAWPASGVATAADDPYVLHRYGELFLGLEGARALADAAGAALDEAWTSGDALGPDERGACAVAIAAAKVASARAGLDVASRLFEVAGARATAARHALDRFWRNLRTHTLHDPIDYKLRELGLWALSARVPTPSFYS